MNDIDNLQYFFVALIVFVFAVSFFPGKKKFRIDHGPEMATTIGIFGTFIGITIAIWNLSGSGSDIISALPKVISGLRTAFAVSAVGVLVAIVYRVIQFFEKEEADKGDGRGQDDKSYDGVVTAINQLVKGIVGTEEGTLLSQLKMQRVELSDGFKQINASFADFARTMAENNQKALIEALNDVIRDFNKQLMEQFGENFKQLNLAVYELVKWQDNYRVTIEETTTLQRLTASELRDLLEQFGEVVTQSRAFSEIATNFKVTIDVLLRQTETLHSQEKALAEVLGTMRNVVPEFSAKIDLMLAELSRSLVSINRETENQIRNHGANLNQSVMAISKSIDDCLKSFAEESATVQRENSKFAANLAERLNETSADFAFKLARTQERFDHGLQTIQGGINDSVKDLNHNLKSTSSELKSSLASSLQEGHRLTTDQIKASLNKVQEGVKTLETGLERELTKSLESLSHQLASLSTKFVEDYTPLTDKLREIVRLAATVRSS